MKTIHIENDFLDQYDHDYLAQLAYDFLYSKGIFPQSIGFKIRIDYLPEEGAAND